MTKRYALRDDQWERIEALLPGREGHVGGTAKDNRRFVEAVLYRYTRPLGQRAASVATHTADRLRRRLPGRPGNAGGQGGQP